MAPWVTLCYLEKEVLMAYYKERQRQIRELGCDLLWLTTQYVESVTRFPLWAQYSEYRQQYCIAVIKLDLNYSSH